MRFNNNPLPAVAATIPKPFAGLGFAVAEVREAARLMIPVTHRHGCVPVVVPVPRRPAVQTGGYKLLVALGREIRGR